MKCHTHPSGGFDFLSGIAAFSSGVMAHEENEIVRAVLPGVIPWAQGFDRIEQHLASEHINPSSLCAIELRCPEPYSSDGFDAFNETYVDRLMSIGVFAKGEPNSVGRTNVAPVEYAPKEQGMLAFTYTRPITVRGRRSFVIAGGGEVRGGAINSDTIVRFGETSPAALTEKAEFVMDVMEKRLAGFGLSWADTRAINVYTKHPIEGPVLQSLRKRIGPSSIQPIMHLTPKSAAMSASCRA
jgi:hypothetical protein